jgi:hypothetical protein
MPELVERRNRAAEALRVKLKGKPLPPVEESAKAGETEKIRDKTLERMLNTPPKPRDG